MLFSPLGVCPLRPLWPSNLGVESRELHLLPSCVDGDGVSDSAFPFIVLEAFALNKLPVFSCFACEGKQQGGIGDLDGGPGVAGLGVSDQCLCCVGMLPDVSSAASLLKNLKCLISPVKKTPSLFQRRKKAPS